MTCEVTIKNDKPTFICTRGKKTLTDEQRKNLEVVLNQCEEEYNKQAKKEKN